MAMMPWKACPVLGCPEVSRGGGRCEKHAKDKRKEYAGLRKTPAKSYGRKWRMTRDAFLTRNPLCYDCLELGRTKVAEMVHHITPLDKGGTHHFSNLMALCDSCHGGRHPRGID
jgi:5-methylcytosine-specific restriction protein A